MIHKKRSILEKIVHQALTSHLNFIFHLWPNRFQNDKHGSIRENLYIHGFVGQPECCKRKIHIITNFLIILQLQIRNNCICLRFFHPIPSSHCQKHATSCLIFENLLRLQSTRYLSITPQDPQDITDRQLI